MSYRGADLRGGAGATTAKLELTSYTPVTLPSENGWFSASMDDRGAKL